MTAKQSTGRSTSQLTACGMALSLVVVDTEPFTLLLAATEASSATTVTTMAMLTQSTR